MQGLILAAGASRRLYPLTKKIPKCLLEIGGMTILSHQLKALKNHNINEVIIVLGYYKDKIIDYLNQNHSEIKFSFIINEQYQDTNTSYSAYLCRDLLTSSDILLMNGDVLYPSLLLKQVIDSKHETVFAVDIKKCGDEEVKVIINNHKQIISISKELPLKESMPTSEPTNAYGKTKLMIENTKNKLEFFKSNPEKALWNLSIPMMFGMSVQAIYMLIDTAFIGQWVGGDAPVSNNFFSLFSLDTGQRFEEAKQPLYADLAEELARRTFKESGHYTTKAFKFNIRENLIDGTNLGLKTLYDLCKIESQPTTYHLGYVLGPRINAGGRVGKSSHGVESVSYTHLTLPTNREV